jgi:hypothetical protein
MTRMLEAYLSLELARYHMLARLLGPDHHETILQGLKLADLDAQKRQLNS